MLNRRIFAVALAAAIGGSTNAYTSAALAQPGGGGPITLVVPFAAGGSTDVVARLLADGLSRQLSRPVIVENRTGAGVMVGTEAVAQAQPDGSTLLFTTVSHAINPALQPSLPYDSEADFVAVSHVATVPLVLSVHPSLPVTTLEEFLDHVRASPGEVSYGSAGIGSVLHMSVELLSHQAELDVLHVPYRGAAPAMTDLTAGNVQFIIDPISTAAAYIEGESIRALAVTSPERSPRLPDVPTFHEAGLADYEASTWNVVMAPRGTPDDVVEEMSEAINEVMADPALVERLKQLDVIPVADSTPSSTAEFIASETERWGEIIVAADITLDE